MLENINRYEINDNVTLKQLIDNGFVFYDTKLIKKIELTDDINLYISIYYNLNNEFIFDNEKDISVTDFANNNNPYYPFYEDTNFKYLQIVINSYNFHMEELVKQGIFKSIEKVKEKNK